MSKTSSVCTRVEPELKEQAEKVLSQLGIPMANAIDLYLHQIVLHKGIPFDVKLPQSKLPDYSTLSQTQFDIEIGKGFASMEIGKVSPSKLVREKMQRQYSL
jgi:DNA-damage-inducible protein J